MVLILVLTFLNGTIDFVNNLKGKFTGIGAITNTEAGEGVHPNIYE